MLCCVILRGDLVLQVSSGNALQQDSALGRRLQPDGHRTRITHNNDFITIAIARSDYCW